MILRISPKVPDFVRVQATRFWTERHYIPNWNFMLKTRTMLIASCQHAISILCSSSSYKIINVKNIIFQIGIWCRRQKIVYIFCLNKTVWYLGLVLETVWFNGNFCLNFVTIAWSCFIAQEWILSEINRATNKIFFLHNFRFHEFSKSISREEA